MLEYDDFFGCGSMKRAQIATLIFLNVVFRLAVGRDFVPLLYRAQTVTVGQKTQTVFVPEIFTKCDGVEPKQCILMAFETLKAQTDIGNTNITVQTNDDRLIVIVSPDPKLDDQQLGEIYLTSISLGAKQVFVGTDSQIPLDFTRIRGLVLAPFVNMLEALPPNEIPFGFVVLKSGQVLPASDFYESLLKRGSSANNELMALLHSQHANDRLLALMAFYAMGAKDATNLVLPMLDDPSPAVRLAVLKFFENDKRQEVLRKIEARIEVENDPVVKVACVRVLHQAGITKYDILLELEGIEEKSEDEVLTIMAGKALSAAPLAVLRSFLVSLVAHKSEVVAKKAITKLFEHKFYEDALSVLSSQTVPIHRREQVATLLADAGKTEKEVMLFLVIHGSAENALTAIAYIQKDNPSWGKEVLLKAIERQEEEVQLASIEALGTYKDPTCIRALATASGTPKVMALAKTMCVHTLKAQEKKLVLQFAKDNNPWIRECAIRALEEHMERESDDETVTMLKEALRDNEKEVRQASASALAKTKRQDVLQTLVSLWDDKDPTLRYVAVLAAGSLTDPASEELIVAALKDPDTDIKKAGIVASKQRSLRSAVGALKTIVLTEGDEIAFLALDALKGFAKDIVKADTEFLINILYSKHKIIRLEALELCERTTDRRVMNAISALVSDREKDVRFKALSTLATTKSRDAIEAIVKGAFDRDKEVRLLAIQALVELGRPEAVDFLREVIKAEEDEELRNKAMEAIEKLSR